MSRTANRVMRLAMLAEMFLVPFSPGSMTIVCAQQAQNRLVTLRGRVVDPRSGEPVAKVKIIVSGSSQSTTTDESGGFTLSHIQPGGIRLFIKTVGKGCVKKNITMKKKGGA